MPGPEQLHELDAVDAALRGTTVPADLQEIASLVRELRGEAPQIRPAFAAQLDERARAGFPRRGARPVLRFGPSMTRSSDDTSGRLRRRVGSIRGPLIAGLTGLAVVAAVVALASQYHPSGDQSAKSALSAPQASPSVLAPGGSQAARSPSAPPQSASGARAAPADARHAPAGAAQSVRQVERGVTLGLTTPSDRLQGTADDVVQTVSRFGGQVASSSVNSSDRGGGQATLEIVVASQRTDAAIGALSALGHVQSLTRDTLDITHPVATSRDRVRGLRALRDSAIRELAQASTPAQTDAAQAKLQVLTAQLGNARSQLAQLGSRAQQAHIHLTLQGVSSPTGATSGWDPGAALGSALRVLEVTADVILVGLAFLLPAGLLIGAPLFGARLLRRRRREQPLVAR